MLIYLKNLIDICIYHIELNIMKTSIPNLLNMISELIAIPSVSCVNPQLDQSNKPVIEKLATWCESLGFHCEILPVPDQTDKYNLLATLGFGDGGLVLAGHTDTVPYNVDQWTSDPFHLTEKDNHLYGLGIADMKAFFALALVAAAQFQTKRLRHPLIILATADEESSMNGAKALVQLGKPKARYAIIGEPTSLRPVRMHKGILMEAIHLKGQSGHSSDPSLGNSALEGMYRVIGSILQWRQELQMNHQNPLFKVPMPTLNLGHIHGGDNPNRICAHCELHIDLRPLPGMKLQQLRETLHNRIHKTLDNSGLETHFFPLFDGIEAMETPADSELVKTAERLTQHQAEAVAFGTEAPYLQALNIQTIVLGPGNIEQAHQPNEFLALDRLQPTIGLLTQFINEFCVAE